MIAHSRVLILGGTSDAAGLAEHLVGAFADRIDVTTSLAGRTRSRRALPGSVRIGGFGGAEGLAAFLETEGFAAVIDATHPFATEISAHAVAAARATGTPLCALSRPPWTRAKEDRWIEAADLADAAQVVCAHVAWRRVFLTVGSGGLAPFASVADRFFLVRVAEEPSSPLLIVPGALIADRGPFTEADEAALLRRHAIDAVVAKNAGGSATYAKIAAARALSLPVVMVSRPQKPAIDIRSSVEDVVRWLTAAVDAHAFRECGAQ